MLGVSLEACLKEKLLQSMMRVKPLIWSSGFSIRTSRESRMARRMSTKEFLVEGGIDQQQIDRDEPPECYLQLTELTELTDRGSVCWSRRAERIIKLFVCLINEDRCLSICL